MSVQPSQSACVAASATLTKPSPWQCVTAAAAAAAPAAPFAHFIPADLHAAADIPAQWSPVDAAVTALAAPGQLADAADAEAPVVLCSQASADVAPAAAAQRAS